jgi:hypothetical protein
MPATDPTVSSLAVSGPAEPELCLDVQRLLQFFEGLGDGCDFGMAQRAVGIEPFGLFRFAGCKVADLGTLLRTNLKQLGESADLWLEEVPPKREYRIKSRQCPSFTSHTRRFGGQDDPEVVRVAQIEAVRFLKRKLIRELSLGRRLFVYRGPADINVVCGVLEELRTYGDNTLLWVRLATDTLLPRSVRRVRKGLLVGFVSRFGIYEPDRTPRIPVEDWIVVCAKAYQLWRRTEPPKLRLQNLLSKEMVTQRHRAPAISAATLHVLDEPAPTGGAVIEHRLGKAELSPVCRLVVSVESGGTFSFSAWIRIPEGFHGRRIIATLPGCSRASRWNPDMNVTGHWQWLWISASLPADTRSISCDLMADGDVGDVFYSAAWCLERRNLPSGYGFQL